MQKMAETDVLLLGLDGLGVEIAKDIVLAGVKSLTVFDPSALDPSAHGTNFFLRPSDFTEQKGRVDEVVAPRLAELNAYVPVKVLSANDFPAALDQIKHYQVSFFLSSALSTRN